MFPALPPSRRSQSDGLTEQNSTAPRLARGVCHVPVTAMKARRPAGNPARQQVGRVDILVLVAVVLLVAALVAVGRTPSPPDAWWPRTGHAFTPTSQPATGHGLDTAPRNDPCDLIVGAAHDYCRHDVPTPSGPAHQEPHGSKAARTATGALAIGALAAGVGALVVLRRRP
ncbi:hypothetical protein [Streptomyces decoyicus]